MSAKQQELRLLPNYFNKIAWGLIGLSILIIVLFKSGFMPLEKETARLLAENGILISLLLFALTRDKVEDELTMRIRVTAFAASFIMGVTVAIVNPFVDLLFGGLTEMETTRLLFTMFFFYFIIFFMLKRQR